MLPATKLYLGKIMHICDFVDITIMNKANPFLIITTRFFALTREKNEERKRNYCVHVHHLIYLSDVLIGWRLAK